VLAVLLALADTGEAHILSCMCNTNSYYSVGCIDAINTYYGRPDIPIGAYKGPYCTANDGFPATIATTFPNDLVNSDNAPEAVDLYREILAVQDDLSVTIVSVGFLTNLELLLQSGTDEHSALDGPTLVTQKVARMVAMAGAFPSGTEWNLEHDGVGPTSKFVIDNWPTPIIFSGFEIGNTILNGATLIDTPAGNPVREIYKLFLGAYGLDRPSWDQTAVLCAVRGVSPYWTTVSTGYCHVYDDGSNEWRATPDADHEYLVAAMSDAEIAAQIEALTVQPPDSNRPVASFTVSVVGRAVALDASSSADADGTIISYQWTFGDGTAGTGIAATHTYAIDGAFEIMLGVSDDDGKTAVAHRSAVVGAPLVVAHWPLDEDAGAIDRQLVGCVAGTPLRSSLRLGMNLEGAQGLASVIDDVRVYGRALTLGEIQAIHLGDSDGDGLSDLLERTQYGTNIYAADSDGDGMGDAGEIGVGYDPIDPDQDGNGVLDGSDDWDGDGTDNQTEIALSEYPGGVPGPTVREDSSSGCAHPGRPGGKSVPAAALMVLGAALWAWTLKRATCPSAHV
jgi:hypothetical protein